MGLGELLATALLSTTFDSFMRVVQTCLTVYMLSAILSARGQIRSLYDWHLPDMPGQPGVKIWWADSGATTALKDIANNTEKTARDIGILLALTKEKE